jgi:hypothetical protein
MKRTALSVLTILVLAGGQVQAGDLLKIDYFADDLGVVLNGIARDVAPTLQLGALSGDLMGDATIDHFNLSVLSISATTSNGIARVLAPDNGVGWKFPIHLDNLVNDNLGDNNFFESLMAYPSLKTGFGIALGTWDFQVSGMYFPQALTDTGVSLVPGDAGTKVKKLSPSFSFGNFGFKVRKTLIEDSGFIGIVPALSLGAGYTLTYFDLGMDLQSLDSIGQSRVNVSGQYLDMNGTLDFQTLSHNFTIDLQASKHLLIFTPFVKLSGAYQLSNFKATTKLIASVYDSAQGTTLASGQTPEAINLSPNVTVSRFAFLTTSGLDINLILLNIDVNVVADMGRAMLNVHDLTLKGIDANAFSLNAGIRFSF